MNNNIILPVLNQGIQVSHIEAHLQTPDGNSGDTDTCVLYLHGFGTDKFSDKATFYREQVLMAGLAYCSFDFQGHGNSGGEFRALTLSRNLADTALVHDFLKSRGFSKIIMMGSSMGGVTGLWHAANHIEDVVAGLYLAPALNMTATAFIRSGDDVDNWRTSGILEFEHRGIQRELGWSFITDLQNYPADTLATSYCAPSLVVQGKQDILIPWEFTKSWAEQCNDNVHYHQFETGDHLLIEEKEIIWQKFYELLISKEIISRQIA